MRGEYEGKVEGGGEGGGRVGTGKGTGKSIRTRFSRLHFSTLPFSFSPMIYPLPMFFEVFFCLKVRITEKGVEFNGGSLYDGFWRF